MPRRKQVDAILCADLHIREDQPLCRTDDYWEAQDKKLKWLFNLKKIHNCPILAAGDIFHDWKPKDVKNGYKFIAWCNENISDIIVIAGQHDTPNHNVELIEKSAIYACKKINLIGKGFAWRHFDNFSVRGFTWGAEITNGTKMDYHSAVLIHTYINTPNNKNEHIDGEDADKILDTLSNFDLVVSGDNHIPFVHKNKRGQILVNPGSMMRMKADQIDHKPRVYLWNAVANEVVPSYFPIEEGVVTRKHIEKKKAKDGKIDSFVQMAKKGNTEVSASFQENMKKHLNKNKARKNVENLIYKCMEEKK
jgi:DNA repair exonuclease SbcCD nuclease subunit